jgi:hypothetical protein
MRIMAAVEPTALVMEKIRNTVSGAAGFPGAASPEAPANVTPDALPVMPTTKGKRFAATESPSTFCNRLFLPFASAGIDMNGKAPTTPILAAASRKSRREVSVSSTAWDWVFRLLLSICASIYKSYLNGYVIGQPF